MAKVNGKKAANISTATTTTVKTGKGKLHAILVNKLVASSVITIYDNTAASGTKLGTITSPGTLLRNQLALNYQGVGFNTGLTIVTAQADDITVVYE